MSEENGSLGVLSDDGVVTLDRLVKESGVNDSRMSRKSVGFQDRHRSTALRLKIFCDQKKHQPSMTV